MTIFTETNQFEFYENVERRQITLKTHEERVVLQFPKGYPEDLFLKTYDFFLDYPLSQLHRVMGEVSNSISGACLLSELKPGLVHDSRHKSSFFTNKRGKKINRDAWSDGKPYEKWCEETPHYRPRPVKPKKTLGDMLNELLG